MAETKEKQQGRILPREDFNLQKFKFTKDGVSIKHHLGGTDPQTQSNECDWKPHPDLVEATKELRLYMASRIGLLQGWDFACEACREDWDNLEKAKSGHEETIERMNVNGLTFLGEGETLGVTITGSIKTPTSGSIGLAVPKITFSKEELGIEEDVEAICEKITDEVYNYLILRKKEQASVEDQAEGFDNVGGVQTTILDQEEKPQTTLEKYQEINQKGIEKESSDEEE